MKTIKTKKMNDIDVVVGFDRLMIDPVASRKQRAKLFEESEAWQEAEPKLKRLRRQATELHNARKQHMHLEVERLEPIVKNLAEEIKSMKEQLAEARQQAHVDGTLRFGLRPGEHEASDVLLDEIATELGKLKQHQYLTLDGRVIDHVEGRKLWRKTANGWEWKSPKFGESLPAAWAPMEELSLSDHKEIEEQIERNRIAALSDSERAQEKQGRLNELDMAAVAHRSMLEIKKSADPLGETQAWHEAETQKIEALYG